MGYLFVRASEHSTTGSGSPNPTTDLWCLSNGKVLPHPPSWRGWKTRPWHQLLSGTRLSPSTASLIVVSHLSLLRASLASRGALPANAAAPTTAGGSGTRSPESLPSLNRESSSLRMSKGSAVTEVSLASLPTLPRSGLMRRGTCLPQQESEPRTGAVGCTWSRGEYPTPAAQEYGTSQNEGKVPHKRPSRGTPSLATWARALWPTAMTTDYKSSGSRCKGSETKGHPGTSLTDAVCRSGRQHLTTCQHGGECLWRLNPLFVAWLMGLPPIGVSGSMQSETLWCRWLQRMRTELSRLG